MSAVCPWVSVFCTHPFAFHLAKVRPYLSPTILTVGWLAYSHKRTHWNRNQISYIDKAFCRICRLVDISTALKCCTLAISGWLLLCQIPLLPIWQGRILANIVPLVAIATKWKSVLFTTSLGGVILFIRLFCFVASSTVVTASSTWLYYTSFSKHCNKKINHYLWCVKWLFYSP